MQLTDWSNLRAEDMVKQRDNSCPFRVKAVTPEGVTVSHTLEIYDPEKWLVGSVPIGDFSKLTPKLTVHHVDMQGSYVLDAVYDDHAEATCTQTITKENLEAWELYRTGPPTPRSEQFLHDASDMPIV